MFGFGTGLFLYSVGLIVFMLIVAIYFFITGHYEGEDMEEKYGEKNWFHTFGTDKDHQNKNSGQEEGGTN